jgi:hypothetical protein
MPVPSMLSTVLYVIQYPDMRIRLQQWFQKQNDRFMSQNRFGSEAVPVKI